MEFKARTDEEKIAFLQSRIKTVIITCIIFGVALLVVGILLGCLWSLWQVSIVVFVCLPIYAYISGYLRVKQFKKEIAEIKEGKQKKNKR